MNPTNTQILISKYQAQIKESYKYLEKQLEKEQDEPETSCGAWKYVSA